MATYHGNDGEVKIGANNVLEVKSFTVDEQQETADDSAMGDTYRTHLSGKKSWSGSITCHHDPTDTTGQGLLNAGDTATILLYPGGDSSGLQELTGSVTVEGESVSVPQDDVVETTFNFKGNGALTRNTVS